MGDKAFSAGWDLNDAAALTRTESYDQFRVAVHNSEGYCGYTKRADIFKPIIAAVNGYAFAAGLELCLFADIRIASENAQFGVTERRWNIVAGDGLCVRLPLVGHAHALDLVITGKRIDAKEAYRIGLVNEIVPQDKLMDRAMEFSQINLRAASGFHPRGQRDYRSWSWAYVSGENFHRNRRNPQYVPSRGYTQRRRLRFPGETQTQMEEKRALKKKPN
mmetsp:Transcript_22024/g.10382  ORF Transcript_22024/g.10382 Transcript_22024/m.10382 type:complete len:219 (+) Transcript_22024:494-1150(+)